MHCPETVQMFTVCRVAIISPQWWRSFLISIKLLASLRLLMLSDVFVTTTWKAMGERYSHTRGKFSKLCNKNTNKYQLRISNRHCLTNLKQNDSWIFCVMPSLPGRVLSNKKFVCWFLPNTSLTWTGSFNIGSGITYP